jgi:hypothetical protein
MRGGPLEGGIAAENESRYAPAQRTCCGAASFTRPDAAEGTKEIFVRNASGVRRAQQLELAGWGLDGP